MHKKSTRQACSRRRRAAFLRYASRMDGLLMDSMPDASGKAYDPVAPQTDEKNKTSRTGAGQRSLAGTARRVLILLLIVSLAFLVGGFLRFATSIATLNTPPDIRADAIVVLTGGADRIKGALDLLAQGRAKRLLISGVHPRTSREAIAAHSKSYGNLFSCCIDLDYKAEDTIGNAKQTRKWVARHDFKSLIVVTSAYHMPRSMAELRNALPNVDLRPYPVVRSDLNLDRWYMNWDATRLLMREYMKYIAARLRLSMNIPPQAQRVVATLVNFVERPFG